MSDRFAVPRDFPFYPRSRAPCKSTEEGAAPSTGTATPTTRSRIEVEITPQISAESRVGFNGSSEIGIGWKRDY
jgi:hypothetical protein